MLPPKEITDPSATKPSDWVDEPTIIGESDTKPEGWDDIPEFIVDATATKPDDWNDDDGVWEAPKIPNPEYKGEWRPKRIPNPAYKGPWEAPKIPNPDYTADPNLYVSAPIGGVGIEIWQVTAGTIFDNIFVGDNVDEAKEFSDRTFKQRKEGEPTVKELMDKEEQATQQEMFQQMETELDFEGDIKEEVREDL